MMSRSTNFLIENLILDNRNQRTNSDTNEIVSTSSGEKSISITSNQNSLVDLQITNRLSSHTKSIYNEPRTCIEIDQFYLRHHENCRTYKGIEGCMCDPTYSYGNYRELHPGVKLSSGHYPCSYRLTDSRLSSKTFGEKSYKNREYPYICKQDQYCNSCFTKSVDKWRSPYDIYSSRSKMNPENCELKTLSRPTDDNGPHEDLAWIVNPRPFYKKEAKKPKRDADPKRDRTTFTKEQRFELEKQFCQGRYPSRYQRADIARKLGLTEFQVKVWFQNRRMKFKRWSSAHMCFYNKSAMCYCPLSVDGYHYDPTIDH